MPQVEEEGRYKGEPFQWGLRESNSADSQSVAFVLKCKLYEKFNDATNSWVNIREKMLEAYGEIWFILRNGEVDDTKLQILMTTLNWDGNVEAVLIPPGSPGALTPPVCDLRIKKNEYKGETQIKIDAIGNSFGFIPKIGGEKAKTMAERINAKMKPKPIADADGGVPF